MGKYAMLLSGGVSKTHNYSRYRNDLEWVYKVLIEDCDYKKDDISVYYADGSSIEYEKNALLTYSAEKDKILEYLNECTGKLTATDYLTIVVTNHGSNDLEGYIHLWGTEYITLQEFADMLNKIKARKVILLGQCYGGNMLRYDIKNCCLLTSNAEGKVSYCNPFNDMYDEFIFHFFSYIHGKYPDQVKINESAENDIQAAFQYACEHDVLRPGSEISRMIEEYSGINCIEIPQIKCNIDGRIEL